MAASSKSLSPVEFAIALSWWVAECQKLVDAEFNQSHHGTIAPPRLKVSLGFKYAKVYYGPWANPLPVSNGFWGVFGWVNMATGDVLENHGQVNPAPSTDRPVRGNITRRVVPVSNYCFGNGGVYHPPF